jgi:hypothetical protein
LYLLHRLWTNGVGLSILVSFSISDLQSLSSWSVDTYDGLASEKIKNALDASQPSDEAIKIFFRRYFTDDMERFSCVTLYPLDKVSMTSFLEEYFEVVNEDYDDDIEKICEISGGIPLYGVELMKSVLTKSKLQLGNNGNGNNQASLTRDIESITTSAFHHRIEEVICYRMDKLDPTIQTLLKAAAVAVSYGNTFNLEILTFMLTDRERHLSIRRSQEFKSLLPMANESKKEDFGGSSRYLSLSDAIIELVQNGMFIQFAEKDIPTASNEGSPVKSTRTGGDGGSNPNSPAAHGYEHTILTSDIIEKSSFEFQIPIEQLTIYNLLIDEQKEYFHERLGYYWCKKLVRSSSSLTLKGCLPPLNQTMTVLGESFFLERLEEAYHWEKALLNPNAIIVYMIVGKYYKSVGKEYEWSQLIKTAFRLFQIMEEEVNTKIQPIEFNENLLFLLDIWLNNEGNPSFPSKEDAIKLHSIFKGMESSIQQVFTFLEGFLDYLPLFIKLLSSVVDIFVEQLEDCSLIDMIVRLKTTFIFTYLYYQLYVVRPNAGGGINGSALVVNANEGENSVMILASLRSIIVDNEQTRDLLFPLFGLALTCQYSIKRFYEIQFSEAFRFNYLDMIRGCYHWLFHHFYLFPVKSSCCYMIEKRMPFLKEVLKRTKEVNLTALNSFVKPNDKEQLMSIFEVQSLSFQILFDFFQCSSSSASTASTASLASPVWLTLMEELSTKYQALSPSTVLRLSTHFNYNHIPLIMSSINNKLLHKGYFTKYSTFQSLSLPWFVNNSEAEGSRPNSSKSGTSSSALVKTTASSAATMKNPCFVSLGLVVMNILPFFLLMEQPVTACQIWQSFQNDFIEKDRIVKIFPYLWKRCIDSFMKEILLFSKSLAISSSAVVGETKTDLVFEPSDSALATTTVAVDTSPKPTKTKKNRRTSSYMIPTTITKPDLAKAKEAAGSSSQLQQLQQFPEINSIDSSTNDYCSYYFLSIESMNLQISFCRLVKIYQDEEEAAVLEATKQTVIVSPTDESNKNNNNTIKPLDKALLEHQFLSFWKLILQQYLANLTASASAAASLPINDNPWNLVFPLMLITKYYQSTIERKLKTTEKNNSFGTFYSNVLPSMVCNELLTILKYYSSFNLSTMSASAENKENNSAETTTASTPAPQLYSFVSLLISHCLLTLLQLNSSCNLYYLQNYSGNQPLNNGKPGNSPRNLEKENKPSENVLDTISSIYQLSVQSFTEQNVDLFADSNNNNNNNNNNSLSSSSTDIKSREQIIYLIHQFLLKSQQITPVNQQ